MKIYISIFLIFFLFSFSGKKPNEELFPNRFKKLNKVEICINDVIQKNAEICLNYYKKDIAFKKGFFYISIDSINIEESLCAFGISKIYYTHDFILFKQKINPIEYEVESNLFTNYFELFDLKILIISNQFEQIISENLKFKKISRKIRKEIFINLYKQDNSKRENSDTTTLLYYRTYNINKDAPTPYLNFYFKKGQINCTGYPSIIPYPMKN